MLRVLVVLVVSCVSVAAWAADTLIVRNQDGSFGPGLASSWMNDGENVRFTLIEGTDAGAVAQALSERLAGAKISADSRMVTISGIPMSRLLDQVSSIIVPNADPLAGIAQMGGTQVAVASPEAGGSIRAAKPTIIAALVPNDPSERLQAEVVDVQRGPFPVATLKLRVKKPAKSGAYAGQLAADKVFNGTVAFVGKNQSIDFAAEANQRNACGYYLQPRDLVYVHVSQLDERRGASIDWIERVNVSSVR